MNLTQALILGFVQGLTEFLPVSSSGHLAIVQSLFSNFHQSGLLYDTLLHLATLFTVFVYFRRRISQLFFAFLGIFLSKYSKNYFDDREYLNGIIIATIPTGVIGFLLKDYSESLFSRPVIIGYLLIVTSIMLFLADKPKVFGKKISLFQSFVVGVSQGLAVFPGISRSGTTIFTGLVVGIPREKAAEFSFLISIPAILGATFLQAKHLVSVDLSDIKIYLCGMSIAFVSGLAAIHIMITLVRKAKMRYFALYCLLVGVGTVIFL